MIEKNLSICNSMKMPKRKIHLRDIKAAPNIKNSSEKAVVLQWSIISDLFPFFPFLYTLIYNLIPKIIFKWKVWKVSFYNHFFLNTMQHLLILLVVFVIKVCHSSKLYREFLLLTCKQLILKSHVIWSDLRKKIQIDSREL